MVESGAEAAIARLCAELDAAGAGLRHAVRDDPDAVAGTALQRDAERVVGQAAKILTGAALPEFEPDRDSHPGREMLARDLLVAVDLAKRAVTARLSQPAGPAD